MLGVHLERAVFKPRAPGAQPAVGPVAPWRCSALARPRPILDAERHLALIAPLRDLGIRCRSAQQCRLRRRLRGAGGGGCGLHPLFQRDDVAAPPRRGMVGWRWRIPQHAELIPTCCMCPGAIQVQLRAIPGLFCVTDATAATGMPRANTGSAGGMECGAWAAWRPAGRHSWPAKRADHGSGAATQCRSPAAFEDVCAVSTLVLSFRPLL